MLKHYHNLTNIIHHFVRKILYLYAKKICVHLRISFCFELRGMKPKFVLKKLKYPPIRYFFSNLLQLEQQLSIL